MSSVAVLGIGEAVLILVTDFPIWDSCPFTEMIPDAIEVRRGLNGMQDTVVLWEPSTQRHVDIKAEFALSDRAWIAPALRNLGWRVGKPGRRIRKVIGRFQLRRI